MSYSLNASSNDDRVQEATRRHQRRQTRFFITFACVEGIVLAAALLAVFGLELVDPALGIGIIVTILVIGGLVMSGGVLTLMRRRTQELRDLGVPPGPAQGDPNNAG